MTARPGWHLEPLHIEPRFAIAEITRSFRTIWITTHDYNSTLLRYWRGPVDYYCLITTRLTRINPGHNAFTQRPAFTCIRDECEILSGQRSEIILLFPLFGAGAAAVFFMRHDLPPKRERNDQFFFSCSTAGDLPNQSGTGPPIDIRPTFSDPHAGHFDFPLMNTSDCFLQLPHSRYAFIFRLPYIQPAAWVHR